MATAVFHDTSLDVVFGLLEQASLATQKGSHWFSQIFAHVMRATSGRATSILLGMMQSDSYETSEAAIGLLPSVAAQRLQELMDDIGRLMLSGERNVSFLFRKYPLVYLPEGVVIGWLEKHGLAGARLLVRHVPAPFIGNVEKGHLWLTNEAVFANHAPESIGCYVTG